MFKVGDSIIVRDRLAHAKGRIIYRVDDDRFAIRLDGFPNILYFFADELEPDTRLRRYLNGEELEKKPYVFSFSEGKVK